MAEALGVIGVAVAIPGLLDLCYQYGDSLNRMVQNTKNAKHQRALHQLRIQSRLSTLKQQLNFLKDLPKPELESFVYEIYEINENAELLQQTLKELVDKPVSHVIWALCEKRRVEDILCRIETSLPSFTLKAVLCLVGSNSSKDIDSSDTTRISGFIQASQVRRENLKDIPIVDGAAFRGLQRLPSSEVSVVKGPSGRVSLVESRGYDGPIEFEAALSRISNVAAMLHESSSEDRDFMSRTGIAQCRGYNAKEVNKLWLIFDKPPQTRYVHSLRAVLGYPYRHSLNDRLRLAQIIAKAGFFTHAYKYVHKNIRPSNIILTYPEGHSEEQERQAKKFRTLGEPLLVGYSDARLNDASSRRSGGVEYSGKEEEMEMQLREQCIYRHHSRDDATSPHKFSFLHDVYSLGVCLLEIGLWQNFSVNDKWSKLSGIERQGKFVERARDALPAYFGRTYAEVVVQCLQGVEEQFGDVDATTDERGIRVGSRYIDHVITKLHEIRL